MIEKNNKGKTMKIKTYYKLARPDGWDFYTGKRINYRDNIGKIVSIFDKRIYALCSDSVIHASCNPNDCFVGASIPCSAYEIEGNPVIKSNHKCGFIKLKVIKEILDLDTLFGWKYSEAINPINPLKIQANKVTKKEIALVKKWDSVRASVWASVGASVRASVRDSVGASVRAYIGSLFPNIKKWKYIDHKEGEYPFKPSVDLWKRGLVPSFDGNIWRLHAGIEAKIVWEGKL